MSTQQMEPREQMQSRRWRIAGFTAILAIVGAVALAILNDAFSGIIGNFATTVSMWLWAQLSKIGPSSLPWLLFGLTVIVSLGLTFYLWWKIMHLQLQVTDLEREKRVLSHAVTTQHNIVLTDDSLFRLLASWIPAKDHEQEMKLILAEVLSEAMVEFNGHVTRASILRPDGESLRVWAHSGMPAESIRDINFYIGPDRHKLRGVAGEAFLEQSLRIGHVTQSGHGCLCDDPNFTGSRRRRFLLYQSFIAIPIIGVPPTAPLGNTAICLGVVCFDSMQTDIFDSSDIQDVLRIFARRIASALLIFEQLP